MNDRQRFLAVMAYGSADRVPNWELGVWPQTRRRWLAEGLDDRDMHWNWFAGEAAFGMDRREFIAFDGSMMPPFEEQVLAEDEQTQTIRDGQGRVRRALRAGAIGAARMSMDQYLRFPVQSAADWEALKPRFDAARAARYEPNWQALRPAGWQQRQHPLIFAPNCCTRGFYWFARDLMGTEPLSYAWYDEPALMHDMMAFWGDFLIEAARPVLAATDVEYICLNEDMAMKTGPLLGPETYKTFILPHLERVVAYWKSHGARYVCIDTDGNPEPLIPMMLDAGIDALWPLERAADQDPVRLRKQFGQSLRLWGGVDKRCLAQGRRAVDDHLRRLTPLMEEGGFIPTVDHTVPPDVSWDAFHYYLQRKADLLAGRP